MTKFAFYGTLRAAQPNYRNFGLDKNAEFLGTAIVEGFTMVNLGWYPMIFKGKDTITVDLFEVTKSEIAVAIDKMEVGAGYNRAMLLYEGEEYVIYTGKNDLKGDVLKNYEIVPGGDWVKYNTNKKQYGRGSTEIATIN
jgi:gamma-glutamylcyclotransferase (GGCT)/AIG2-like uncharacterized protein YtfP